MLKAPGPRATSPTHAQKTADSSSRQGGVAQNARTAKGTPAPRNDHPQEAFRISCWRAYNFVNAVSDIL